MHPGGGTVLFGAPRVSNSAPAVAVESLEATVLLTNCTRTESWIDTPPPAQPATLLAKMLLATRIEYHWPEWVGLFITSVPLAIWIRKPPPLPLSAVLPRNRLWSTTVPGPAPSDSGGGQSMSISEVSHSDASVWRPYITAPPPQVVMVGLLLWLNRNALCETVPLYMNP